ncbi:EAL domain-containing protein [Paucibacter sp. R3-3]|uniref:EAL domain-containing protein n=1 Tax=Roseateles agri TaxID=3098619 RepID=A0ABU5D9D0_9BURK|nr:EAL domain-containing protein [Paucibacter sp. R3-3]MDY0742877.1 EAL domain-containing protein [Paucibacter sp. R3-3]
MNSPLSLQRERRLQAAYLCVALLASALAFVMWANRERVPGLQRLERLTLDSQFGWRGPIRQAAPMLIVSIDDATLQSLGTIAPDRAQVAKVIERLSAGGARVIAMDTLFLQPARPSPASDDVLAAAMHRAGNVLIPFALPESDVRGASTEVPGWMLDETFTRIKGDAGGPNAPLKPQRAVPPIEKLARAAVALGHVTVKPEPDGAVRFDLPGLVLDGELYPSMALRIAALAQGVDWKDVQFEAGRQVVAGPLHIPLDLQSRQWLDYYGPGGTIDTISFLDVLQGKIPGARFKNRIVLIGTVALGSGDTVPSPFDARLPGVERLATVVDNILGFRVLEHPAWGQVAELIALLVLSLLAVCLVAMLRPLVSLLLLAGIVALIASGLQWLLVAQQQFLSPTFPLLALAMATLGALMLRNSAEQARRRRAMNALRASEQRYALALQGAKDGMWDWDIASGEVYFSDRWMRLMRLSDDQARDMNAWTLQLDIAGRQQFEDALAEHLAGRSQQLNHVLNFRQGGGEVWLLVRGVATRDSAAKPLRMAGSLTDISQERQLQHQITFDALHDRLTGLPNRAAFLERLAQVFTGSSAAVPQAGVVLVDIDAFRALNEGQGTAAGDSVLHELGRRLRTRDGQPLNVARLGADRFGLLFTVPLGAGGVDETRLANWVLAQMRQPFQVGLTSQVLTCSIGWAHASQGLTSPEELMSAAEMALAHAKAHRRGHIHVFDPAEMLVENSRRWLKENIALALERDEFRLYYQPLVRLKDRQLLGFEALIRWPHPTRGMVMPGDFIPFAEESGQIVELGRWTLQEVARQLVRWDALGFTGEIAVNLSGMQFTEGDLEADARAMLAVLGGIDPHRIKLEVTESMAMSNPQRTALVLQTLATLGFKISIDDFGTGYSSLAYLHRFPFDTLKIDRSFVMRLASGREAVEIVRTIVGLALALDKQVLAEGVEEESQAQLLQELGVHIGQGWLFAKALPVDQAQALFAAPPRAGIAQERQSSMQT